MVAGVVVAVVDVVAVIVETGVGVATAEIAATAGNAIRSFSWRRESWPVPLLTLLKSCLR
jgi:hypothetical protein